MVSVMTAAESARDVLSAIAHPVSYVEVAAHLARDYSPELFDAVTGLVLCHAEEMSGPELSNILWAYTTVGHHDEGLLASVLGALGAKVSELGPGDLANTAWAMARHEAYEPELVAALSERVWEALPACSPRQLAALAQGFAYFRQQEPQLEEDEDLLKSISARFREQVDSASAPEVATLLSALARLRRYDPVLLADACRLLAAAAPSAPLCALAEATWALALLQYVHEPLLEAVVDRVTEAARVASGLAPAPQSVATSVSSSLPIPLRAGTAAAAAATMAVVAKNTQCTESVQLATALQNQASSLAKDQRRAAGAGGFGSGLGGLVNTGGAGGAGPAGAGAGAGGEVGSASTGGSVPTAYAGRKARSRGALAAARGGGAPAPYSAMWPTQVGPGGHLSPCTLAERFNPSLPFNWSAEATGAGAMPGAPGAAGAASKSQQGPLDAATGSAAAAADKAAAEDAAALADPDTVSKFLWGFGALHCYSDPLYTLLFRVLPRLRHDRASWSALARLMGAHLKALELQPGVGLCRINPLEAESTTAWIRLQRSRTPLHRMPDHFLTSAFVAFQAEGLGRDHDWAHPAAQRQQEQEQHVDRMQPQPPHVMLSRLELESEVAATLRAMGVELRPSATIDGLFALPHTMLINGMTLSVEVLSAGCCALDPPHHALGPAVARLRSLEFRGWSPLVVPFHEWAALAAEEGPAALLALTGEPDGAAKRAAALQAAAAARQRYLLCKLEEVVGEKINEDELRRTQKMPRRRLA
ncbi:hypothetical protein HYH02_006218 [Chlamydomonas schloesseri]|uniref:RAP domain-containing protein n=1 Tax=Chlamydomonas schloesseri TaxID=2026947 RepID=A0A836B6I5_9CHLO|nr:hypothetical protein HYH02_006218 [Chlamydomonas schloesseri]|eukprot:KAG2448868.1 hypothetical protein HYH02_006218 [Chlamydomonas schloesseri]